LVYLKDPRVTGDFFVIYRPCTTKMHLKTFLRICDPKEKKLQFNFKNISAEEMIKMFGKNLKI